MPIERSIEKPRCVSITRNTLSTVSDFKNDTIVPGSNLPFGFTEQIDIVTLLDVTEWHVVYMLWSNFEEFKL